MPPVASATNYREAMPEIVLLLASPLHRYEGRPSEPPVEFAGDETPDHIEVRAGLGVVGDRFFGKRAHVFEAVTIQSSEGIQAAADSLGLPGLDARRTRRNIITSGLPIDEMRGEVFSLDSGDGPVRFRAHRPANPCAWMDSQLAPGAFRALRSYGGMRCEPLDDGVLRLGAITVTRGL